MTPEQTYFPDKTKFKDSMGKYITQALFLEYGYDTEKAVYSFKDTDYEYKGVLYPSARRLYLETGDPTEYEFAIRYFWGWEQWKQITANQALRQEILKWREELEIKLRSQGVRNLLSSGLTNTTAAAWAADGKWRDRPTGRPNKRAAIKEKATRKQALNEAENDAHRLGLVTKGAQ